MNQIRDLCKDLSQMSTEMNAWREVKGEDEHDVLMSSRLTKTEVLRITHGRQTTLPLKTLHPWTSTSVKQRFSSEQVTAQTEAHHSLV